MSPMTPVRTIFYLKLESAINRLYDSCPSLKDKQMALWDGLDAFDEGASIQHLPQRYGTSTETGTIGFFWAWGLYAKSKYNPFLPENQ